MNRKGKSVSDTPTHRASINQLSVDQLDVMLTAIRQRRLERVQKLEALARVKADDAQLVSWLAFERAYGIAARYLKKCEAMEDKAEDLIRKVRLKMLVVQFEVDEQETEDA
jgi:hypothetical protein